MKKSLLVLLTTLLAIFMVATFSLAEGVKTEIPEEFQNNINWRQFEGEEINVLFSAHPWQEALEPYIPEFESLTGIKVNLDIMPDSVSQTKVMADLSSGTFSYDIFMGRFFDAPKFTLEKWTAPLDEFLNNPILTDSEWYDLDDFFDSALTITKWGEYRDRLPITTEASILIYRKDVFEKLDLQVPETFDELLNTVEKISDSNLGINGITVRGGTGLWYPFYSILRSYGGDYWNEKGEIQVNSSESVAALEMLIKLAKYCPPGITDYDWDQVNTAMLNNQAATFIDSSVCYSRLMNPEISKVVGKINAAPYPIGPAGRQSLGHHWSVCMSNSSKHKPQSWLFLEWATSQPIQKKLALNKILPPRASIWDDEDFISAYPSDYIDALNITLKNAVSLQIAPKAGLRVWQLANILTREVQSAIMGQKDAQTAMDDCASQWNKILK